MRVYLNPDTGRFNRLDPWLGNSADPQSLHKYAYAHLDPVNGIDPSGRLADFISFLITSAVIGVIAGLIVGTVVGVLKGGSLWDVVESALVGAVIGGIAATVLAAILWWAAPGAVATISGLPVFSELLGLVRVIYGWGAVRAGFGIKHFWSPLVFASGFVLGFGVGFYSSMNSEPSENLRDVFDWTGAVGLEFVAAELGGVAVLRFLYGASVNWPWLLKLGARPGFYAVLGFTVGYGFGRMCGEFVFRHRLLGVKDIWKEN